MEKNKIDIDLRNYIIKYFMNCLKDEEKFIYNLIVTYRKVKDVDDKLYRDLLLKKMNIRYSDIKEMETFDVNKFYDETITRVINDEDVFINRCPYCGTLARTPSVRRAKCGHSW